VNTYEKGKLYQFNGSEFIELEPSGDIKIPVTEEAMNAVKSARKLAHSIIGMRPELSLVASAMILNAAEYPDIAQSVKSYGQRIYNNAMPDSQIHPQQNAKPVVAQAKLEQTASSYLELTPTGAGDDAV